MINKDLPMMFSAPMIAALLAGRKTQTRRVVKPQPKLFAIDDKGTLCDVAVEQGDADPRPRVRLGRVILVQEVKYAVGDRIWVTENWRVPIHLDAVKPLDLPRDVRIYRDADGPVDGSGRHRAPFHMPRRFSRMTLIVTETKLEALNVISDNDTRLEGIVRRNAGPEFHVPGLAHPDPAFPYLSRATRREMYAALWDCLHGSGKWLGNPIVQAITFAVHQCNIDSMLREAA